MKNFILSLLLILVAFAGFGQTAEVYTKNNAAIGGYDPVAYFKLSKPTKGNAAFTYEWNKAVWYFSSKENMEDFKANPEKYVPQYGGYCAYGMSEGHKAPTDPEAWTIVDGELYLNYNPNVKTMWVKDSKSRIEKANINWPLVKDKE